MDLKNLPSRYTQTSDTLHDGQDPIVKKDGVEILTQKDLRGGMLRPGFITWNDSKGQVLFNLHPTKDQIKASDINVQMMLNPNAPTTALPTGPAPTPAPAPVSAGPAIPASAGVSPAKHRPRSAHTAADHPAIQAAQRKPAKPINRDYLNGLGQDTSAAPATTDASTTTTTTTATVATTPATAVPAKHGMARKMICAVIFMAIGVVICHVAHRKGWVS